MVVWAKATAKSTERTERTSVARILSDYNPATQENHPTISHNQNTSVLLHRIGAQGMLAAA